MSQANPAFFVSGSRSSQVIWRALIISGAFHFGVLLALKFDFAAVVQPVPPAFVVDLIHQPAPEQPKSAQPPAAVAQKSTVKPVHTRSSRTESRPVLPAQPEDLSVKREEEPAQSVRLFSAPDPFSAPSASKSPTSGSGKDFNAGLRNRARLPDAPKDAPEPESRKKLARDIASAFKPTDISVQTVRLPNGQLIAITHSSSGKSCVVIEDSRSFGMKPGTVINCPADGPWRPTPLSG